MAIAQAVVRTAQFEPVQVVKGTLCNLLASAPAISSVAWQLLAPPSSRAWVHLQHRLALRRAQGHLGCGAR